MADVRQQIADQAQAYGLDPSYALAVAERESSLNPNAGGTGTIRGAYQMTRAIRKQYGVPERNATLDQQTRGFADYTRDLSANMKQRLGRDPTNAELYLGHHFGPYRAAKMASGAYPANTPVTDVFSALEMQGNPHFARAGTTGNLASSIMTDMHRRMGKYGAPRPPGVIPGGPQPMPTDFEAFAGGPPGRGDPDNAFASANGPELASAPKTDFSEFGSRLPAKATPTMQATPPAPTPAGVPQPAPQWPEATDKSQLDPAWGGGTKTDKPDDFSSFGSAVPLPRPRPKQKTAALEPDLGNEADDQRRAARKDEMDIKRDRNDGAPLQLPEPPPIPPSMPVPTQIGLNPEIFGTA